MSSSRTVPIAASKFTGFGSSLITFQPVSAQRLVSSTALVARVLVAAPTPAAPRRSADRRRRRPVGLDDARPWARWRTARAQLGGDAGRVRAARGHGDHRQLVGQVQDAGVVELEVAAVVRLVPALPQQVDDLERLAEDARAASARRGSPPDDVLVEPLARADAEREAVVGQDRTVAAACAMIAGWYRKDGQVTPVASPIRVGGGRDRAEHRPGEAPSAPGVSSQGW